ncbi:hypothetical protein FNF27_00064 [Cafeteria roenbergensis]|uniref:Tubby C-terminal domain-containing protein n=3 Tax=Cafeteria roenbergensis TaxID=33653 RepID=A0A5A8CNW0_CAFRO|nr:hypothetical protein FNF31_06300 [Cafeteria roenbergensis]KAA0168664.1 hypothetical protein FNF28_02404 [Cafeteria roenbergensis]KAA0178210.1 hypothetical protein FNF27_00064 [Cafeteria roenbergensis]
MSEPSGMASRGAAGASPAQRDGPEAATFRFELRTSKQAPPSSFDHEGAEAALDGIEMGEYSRKATVVLTLSQLRRSPYYASQLAGPWSGKRGVRLTLPTTQHLEAMQAVLSSMEDSRSVVVTEGTQLQVLSLAHKLQLSALQERCERYVALNLNEDTIIGALAIAEARGMRGLARCCYSWIKRSSDPNFAGSTADAIAREVERRVDEISGGAAAAGAAAVAGGGWGARRRGVGADDVSSAQAMGPAFDVDGISGKLQGRDGRISGLETLVELSRQEREAKRAFFLPVDLVDMPASPPPLPPQAAGGAGRRAGERGGGVDAFASGAGAGWALQGEGLAGEHAAGDAGDFLGDEDADEAGEAEEDGRVTMFAAADPTADPLGASQAAAAAKAAAAAAAADAEKAGIAHDSDDEGEPVSGSAAGGDGEATAGAPGKAAGAAAAGAGEEAAAEAAAAPPAPEGPSAMDLAIAADEAVELGYVCPEPLSEGVIQAEDVARYRELKLRREQGRLARFLKVKKPRRAGYPGMNRCYIRRVRDGFGACRQREPEQEWRRVVRELLGEDKDSTRTEAEARVRRPAGAAAVIAASKGGRGVPMCGRGRRHYYELRRERDHSLIMAAVCVDESGSFVFTRRSDDVRPHGRHYIGAVRGDRLGTRFLIHDFGMSPGTGPGPARRLAEIVPSLAQRIVAEVHFDTNVMGTVPNSCSVVLHPTPANSQAEDLLPKELNMARQRSIANQSALAGAGILASATRFVSSVFEGGAAMLFSMDGDASPVRMPDAPDSTSRSMCIGVGRSKADAADAHSSIMADHVAETTGVRPAFAPRNVVKLASRQPDWNEDMEAWTMDFRSRATLASKKNFQLVPSGQRDDAEPDVIFLMGKRGKDLYSLDFARPLSPAAAFGIALTSFAQKWAVA